MYQNFIKNFLLSLFLFAIPICGNWVFLLNCGELSSIEDIVKKQLNSSNYYIVGLATRNQGYYYKKEMYRHLKPEILMLGSSRVMEFRKEFFSRPMFNAGGSMSSVNEGFSFIQEAFAYHIPSVVILGIDFWWFNKNVVKPSVEVKPPRQLSHRVSFRNYLLPYKWLWQRKITMSEYLEKINPLYFLLDNVNGGIGVDGKINKNGFAPDGSYVYTKYVYGKEQSLDKNFIYSRNIINQNNALFEKGAYVDETHFQNFLEMLAFLKKHRVQVILFIPPLAPAVIDMMDNFTMIDDLRKKLTKANIAYYDFHDPSILNTNNCEFIDGTHGGDVLYAKILAYIEAREESLTPYVSTQYIQTITQYYNDLAMIPRKEISQKAEVDFLNVGCDKLKATAYAVADKRSLS